MSVPATDARAAHAAGVQRLLASYRAIPPAATVRLAKPTSNLFRARAKSDAKGLDVSGEQQTKTKTALEFFAAELSGDSGPEPAVGPG